MRFGRGHHRVRRHFEEAAAIDLRGAFRRGRRRRLHRRDPGPPDAGGVRGWAHLNPKSARSQVIGGMTMGTARADGGAGRRHRRGFFANHDPPGTRCRSTPTSAPGSDLPRRGRPDVLADEGQGRRRTRHLRGRRRWWRTRSTTPPASACGTIRSRSTSFSTACPTRPEQLKGARPCASPSGSSSLAFP